MITTTTTMTRASRMTTPSMKLKVITQASFAAGNATWPGNSLVGACRHYHHSCRKIIIFIFIYQIHIILVRTHRHYIRVIISEGAYIPM